jgi:hypothetical protein
LPFSEYLSSLLTRNQRPDQQESVFTCQHAAALRPGSGWQLRLRHLIQQQQTRGRAGIDETSQQVRNIPVTRGPAAPMWPTVSAPRRSTGSTRSGN